MRSTNMYVKYATINSSEDVFTFVNEGAPIISNSKTYQEDIKKLMDYKNKHKKAYKETSKGSIYHNVFAHYVKVMIPHQISDKQADEFIKKFIENVDKRFLKLLWIYKKCSIGDGNYAEILFFSRYVYKKPRKENEKYNQDYFYNSETGKRCNRNHPNAVLKAKKGQLKTKKDGSPITSKKDVKDVEERVFKFRNFNTFINKLKGKVLKTVNQLVDKAVFFQSISRITVKETDSKVIRKAKYAKNEKIREINDILSQFQTGINDGRFYDSIDDIYKKFHQLLKELDEMIHKKNETFQKIKEFSNDWWIKNIAGDFIN